MGLIEEQPRVQGIGDRLHIFLHIFRVRQRVRNVGRQALLCEIMLSQNQIVNGELPVKIHGLPEKPGHILHFQADIKLDLSPEFRSQGFQGSHIPLQLLRGHADVGNVTVVPDNGSVVRKAQYLIPSGDGLLHIFPVQAGSMVAAGGVRVEIGLFVGKIPDIQAAKFAHKEAPSFSSPHRASISSSIPCRRWHIRWKDSRTSSFMPRISQSEIRPKNVAR